MAIQLYDHFGRFCFVVLLNCIELNKKMFLLFILTSLIEMGWLK